MCLVFFFKFEDQIKMFLDKFDGVKQEFKVELDRLLVKQGRGRRLEIWLGRREFVVRYDLGRVEGLEVKELFKVGVSKQVFKVKGIKVKNLEGQVELELLWSKNIKVSLMVQQEVFVYWQLQLGRE